MYNFSLHLLFYRINGLNSHYCNYSNQQNHFVNPKSIPNKILLRVNYNNNDNIIILPTTRTLLLLILLLSHHQYCHRVGLECLLIVLTENPFHKRNNTPKELSKIVFAICTIQ